MEPSKNELQIELAALRLINESPKNYLSNYFNDLRSKVKSKMTSKVKNAKDQEIQRILNESREKIIEKINSFESQCMNNNLNSSSNPILTERLNSFELEIRNAESANNLNRIKQLIQNEETNILKQLFQNKTISFVELNQDENASDQNSELIDCKLVILNDEFINNRLVKQRYYLRI